MYSHSAETPLSGKIQHALEQLSLCATTLEPVRHHSECGFEQLGRIVTANQRQTPRTVEPCSSYPFLVCLDISGCHPSYAESSGKVSPIQQPLNWSLQGGESGSQFLINFLK